MTLDAQVIVVSTLKGGTRKTTTAMFLAFAFSRRDDLTTGLSRTQRAAEETLVIDADPYTQGVTDWMTKLSIRTPDLPFHVGQWAPGKNGLLVPFILDQMRRGEAATGKPIRRILIDVGGEAPEVLAQGAELAANSRSGLVLSPVGAEQAEIGRIAETANIARRHRARHRILLSRVPAVGIGAAAAARGDLAADGFDVLAPEIPRNLDMYCNPWGTNPRTMGAYGDVAALARQGVL